MSEKQHHLSDKSQHLNEEVELTELIDAALGAYFGAKVAKKTGEALKNTVSLSRIGKAHEKRKKELEKAKEFQRKRAEKHRSDALKKEKEASEKLKKDQAERAKRFMKRYRKRKAAEKRVSGKKPA